MKFLWKGKAHRKTETEAVRFGLRFLYFTAGREKNQLERFSNDRIAIPPTEQGFLEFKESKTRLLHGNKLRQQIVGDYLRGVGIFRQIGLYKSFFLEVLKLLAFQGIWMFLCSQFPLFFPLPGKNKGKSYCTLSSSFAASRLASLLACA